MIYDQVIDDDVIEEGSYEKIKNTSIIYRFVIIIAMSLFLPSISLSSGIFPMPYVILGVASIFNVPLLMVGLLSALSMFIVKLQSEIIVSYLFFFIVYTVITSLLNINGLSKRYAVLMKLLISVFLVNVTKVLFLSGSASQMFIYLFVIASLYIVFVYGVTVIINIRKGYVFTNEEQICAICIATFFITVFRKFNIVGVSFSNVIAIMIILMYGYRKGSILGCVSGFIAGLVISTVSGTNMSLIITLAAGGLVSGFMNKIGKTATVIGFIIGSAIISYFTSNFAYYSANIIEIVIAAIPVLVIPKKISKKIEDFFNFNNKIGVRDTNLLSPSKSAESKIKAISNVFDNMSETVIDYTKEEKLEFRETLKKYIIDYLALKEESKYSQEDINVCVEYISSKLEKEEEIDPSMIILNVDNKEQMISNLKDIYSNIKIMRILKKKEIELEKKSSNEYKEISRILSSSIEKNSKMPVESKKKAKSVREELKMLGYVVYEDNLVISEDYIEYTFITDILVDIDKQKSEIVEAVSLLLGKNMMIRLLLNISKTEKSKIKLVSVTKYNAYTGIKQKCKSDDFTSGDSYICMNFEPNKYITTLSDGAGTGKEANNSSKIVINTLSELVKAGFDEMNVCEIVNKVITMKQNETSFASLDMAIIDLETADARFIKFGAAPTYILSDSKVTTINSMNMPVGIVNESEYIPIVKKLCSNDIIVQVTDGAIIGSSVTNNIITEELQKINVNLDEKDIASRLMEKIIEKFENIQDDITIAVTKVTASKLIK